MVDPPTTVGGRYRVLDVVGRGGEATVVKAVDTRHDRLVALKVRPVPDGADAAAAQLAEARALLSLPGHDGLAHARDDFFDAGRHVLVLDWVDGLDLATVLASQGQPGLPASSVLRWMAQTADGLTELHAHGVVHGDIKPANLVLDQRGRVVLVDLGSSSIPSRSEVGGGTPGYRAPEVAAGEIPTRASDVYGLAATAFALLTGQPPAGVLPSSWGDAAPDQARVLEGALRAGLAVDPTRRPATPGEFVERLRAGSDERTPSGVVTVLLTDVVGSTELWEHAPAQMPAVLAELQLAVDLAVAAHGGSRLGATVEGDSTISAFPVAADAVAAAVTLQQRLGAPGLSGTQLPPLRVGLATGEVHSVGADVVGPAVNRAARIRELAGPGEVFLSATTAAVVAAAPPAGVALVLMGSHALRGVAGRDEVHAVVARGVATPPDPSRCPYPGLAPFEPDDAAFFVGREALVEECLEHLARTGFVGVIGGSGTGKSSLVRAGVVPRLERAVVFTPGEHPIDALRAATAPDAVLVVDQLEEVVTLCRDPDEQAAFLDAVCSGSTAGAVVTVRADLYGELAGFGEFSRMLAANHVLVGPMGPDELARTVTEPAAHAGLQVETGLADLVVNELHNQPGSLPLLAHALRETWLRRDGRRLTITGYRDAGGVREAIARTADRVLADLTDAERAVTRDLLLRMVEVRDDGDDARRWVALDEVQELGGDGPAMLDRLAAARLVTVESDRATLAHEALLTAWPTLRDWLRDERATLLLRQQLRRATDAWVHGGRSEADLYRGSRLDAALEWQAATQAPLTAVETAFLDVSAAQTAARTRQQARQNRRLRVLLAIAAVGFVVAATAGVVALGARDRAQRSAADAVARRLSALALTVEDLDQALLLAVEARHLHDSIETRSNLLAVLNRMPQAIDLVSSPAGDPWLGMALTGDGSLLAVARQDGITLYDGDTLAPTGSMEPLYIWAAAPMPGGRELAVLDIGDGPEDRPLVRFVDGDGAMTREPLALPRGHIFWVATTIAVSADGRFVAVTAARDPDREAPALKVVLDLWAPDEPPVRIAPGGPAPAVAFTATNRVVIGSGPDGAEGGLSVVDPTTGTTELVIDGLGRPFAVNPEGTLVAGRRGDAVVIADLATGEEVRVLRTRSLPRAVAFAPDGQLLATAGSDRSIEVWETASGARRELLAGHSAPATHLAFRADGATLLSGSDDGAVIAWDLTGDRRVVRQLAAPALVPPTDRLVFRVTPSPDIDTAAYLYGDQVGPDDFALRDLRTGEFRLVQSTGHPNEAFQGWTADGRHLVTVGSDRVARLWDSRTGSLTAERTVSIDIDASSEFSRAETIGSVGSYPGGNSVFLGLHAGGVVELDADTLDVVGETLRFGGSARNVDVSPDGRLLAVGLADFGRDEGFRVELVDRVSGDTVATFDGVDAQWSLEFSPDGALLAAGGDDGLITLIDPRERTVLGAPLRGVDGPVVTLTFSSDGRQFVTNSFDGTVELWDVADRGRVARLTPGEPGYAAFAWFGEGDATVVVADERDGLWSISSDPDEWERRACEMAGRNLTEAEWSQTVPEREYRATCPDNPS